MLWQSNTMNVDGVALTVRAQDEGVTIGRTVDGVYAAELLLTPEQAMQHADDLTRAATIVLQARG